MPDVNNGKLGGGAGNAGPQFSILLESPVWRAPVTQPFTGGISGLEQASDLPLALSL